MSAAEDWYAKGKEQQAAGDVGGAIQSFNRALKEKPDFVDACLDLARLLDAAKQTDAAIKIYGHWLRLLQRNGVAVFPVSDPALGRRLEAMLAEAERFSRAREPEKATRTYRDILDICPGMPTAELGIAIDLHRQHRYQESADILLSVIRRISGYAAALNALASSWRHLGLHAQAIAAYHQAIGIEPRQEHVWANILRAYMAAKQYDQNFVTLEKLQQYAPQDNDALAELAYLLASCCRWKELAAVMAHIKVALGRGACFEPFKALNFLSAEQQYKNAQSSVHKLCPKGEPYDRVRPFPADARGDAKLRIGYLSSDFHTHATVMLIAELFELHDQKRFDIYAYSCGPNDKSDGRRRIEKCVRVFRDLCAQGAEEIAKHIRVDQIDILVDLKGHTRDNRLDVMALRPAPVQMHYLGYPGTTGATFIDYFLTDDVASPERADLHFTEKLIRLPGSYQINDRKRVLPAKKHTRADYGLPENAFVFCNFNAPYKNTPEMFAVWMRLLKQVEGSVLWLYSGPDKRLPHMCAEAEAQGVDPARVVFASSLPAAEHLERYLYADLCLDTFPVCSHTTASDALWCATPLVTMTGDAFVSRVAASLLQAVALPELVTHNFADYEQLALALARDPVRMAKLKNHLEKGRMTFSLFDSQATTRAIEAAYAQAALLHREGKEPHSFTLTPSLEVL